MTTQATPDFNTALADKDTAIKAAQALADNLQRLVDTYRMRCASLDVELMTTRTDRDVLMSELGEAIQGLMVGEEGLTQH